MESVLKVYDSHEKIGDEDWKGFRKRTQIHSKTNIRHKKTIWFDLVFVLKGGKSQFIKKKTFRYRPGTIGMSMMSSNPIFWGPVVTIFCLILFLISMICDIKLFGRSVAINKRLNVWFHGKPFQMSCPQLKRYCLSVFRFNVWFVRWRLISEIVSSFRRRRWGLFKRPLKPIWSDSSKTPIFAQSMQREWQLCRATSNWPEEYAAKGLNSFFIIFLVYNIIKIYISIKYKTKLINLFNDKCFHCF